VLDNCAAAARPGARVVLLEQILSDPPEAPFDALMDLHMLLVVGGRERTEREYASLFGRAGLRYVCTTRTTTPLRLIEGRVPS
jgi:C-methyltransferase